VHKKLELRDEDDLGVAEEECIPLMQVLPACWSPVVQAAAVAPPAVIAVAICVRLFVAGVGCLSSLCVCVILCVSLSVCATMRFAKYVWYYAFC